MQQYSCNSIFLLDKIHILNQLIYYTHPRSYLFMETYSFPPVLYPSRRLNCSLCILSDWGTSQRCSKGYICLRYEVLIVVYVGLRGLQNLCLIWFYLFFPQITQKVPTFNHNLHENI